MKNVSKQYLEKMQSNLRTFVPRMTIDGVEISGEIQAGLSVTLGSCGNEQFAIGACFIPTMTATITECSTPLQDKEILLEMGLVLDDGTVEYKKVGYFTVERPDKDKFQTSFTAYGRLMSKAGSIYISNLTFPATIASVLDDIEKQTGLNIVLNGLTAEGTINTPIVGELCREVLVRIAGLLGCFVTEDGDGNIVLSKYSLNKAVTVDTDFCYSYPETNENPYTVTGIEVVISEGGTDNEGNAIEGVKYSSETEVNVIIQNPYMTESLFKTCEANIVGFSYMPAKVEFLGDIRLEPWDSIVLTDEDPDAGIDIPCMNISHVWDGGLVTTITAPGKTSTETSSAFGGPLSKLVERTYQQLLLAEQVIAKKVTAEYVDANYASIEKLDATKAYIEALEAKSITTENLSAKVAVLGYAKVDELAAEVAKFGYVKADELEVTVAKFGYAKIDTLNAVTASIEGLLAQKANIDLANIKEACITEAMIADAQITTAKIRDGAITEATIHDGAVNTAKIADAAITNAKIDALSADKITSGTLETERLILVDNETGKRSVITALNEDAKNKLDGAVIQEKTIDAAKITVADLKAFGATIGGFDINSNSIHSNKTAINDPTAGVYISTTGIGVGDGTTHGINGSPFEVYADGTVKMRGKNGSIVFDPVSGNIDIVASSFSIGQSAVVVSTEVTYQGGTSPTTPPTGEWISTIPSVPDGGYLWTKTVTTYSDSTTEESYIVTKQGSKGETGVGVKAVVTEYCMSTSETDRKGASWKETLDLWTPGRYLWTRSRITWSDGSVTYTAPVLERAINSANYTADTANSTANDVDSVIGKWCYNGNKTYINGANIYTGSITADKIDVNDLFAQNIFSRGVIKGAHFEGATGEFTGKITATTGTIGGFEIGGTYLDAGNTFRLDSRGSLYMIGGSAYQYDEQYIYPIIKMDGGYISLGALLTDAIGDIETDYPSVSLSFDGIHFFESNNPSAWLSISNLNKWLDIYGGLYVNGKTVSVEGHTHNYLNSKGTNTISSTDSDTVANWGTHKFSIHWYQKASCLTDQPSTYGHLLNVSKGGTEVQQLWFEGPNGDISHRGGNASGWSGTWKKLLDSNNYKSYALPLSGGTVTGTLTLSKTTDADGSGANSPALIVGGTAAETHMEIDANEIITTNAILYVQSGGTTETTKLKVTDGITVSESNKNQIRAKHGDYGFIIRNDGVDVYFMLTKAGDPDGGYNDLRPLAINCSNGRLSSMTSYNTTTSSAANMYVGNTGVFQRSTTSSSRTIKHDIKELLNEDLKAENLYNLPVHQFKYNEDIITDKEDSRYMKDMPGFIIEELNEIYPIAVDKSSANVKEWSWNERYLIPPMLKLIQDHKKKFDIVDVKIASLEAIYNARIIALWDEIKCLKERLAS